MRIALMADIHANLEAFEACLAHAKDAGVDRHVFLGDYVGYGADPAAVVAIVSDMVAGGAIAVLGNHDFAVSHHRETMNPHAQTAIAWTRDQLSDEARGFLDALPLSVEEDGRLYVHAEATAPKRWGYIAGTEDAARDLRGSEAQATFCGHVHVPSIYGITAAEKIVRFRPVPGVPVPIPRHRRWLAVLGSVGQPRCGDNSAAYAILDTARAEITLMRVPYDIEGAASKIRAAGLPEALALRLYQGR